MSTTVNRNKIKARAKMLKFRLATEGERYFAGERERHLTRKQRTKRAQRQAK